MSTKKMSMLSMTTILMMIVIRFMRVIKTLMMMMMMMIHHRKHCRGNVHCRLSSRAVSRWLRSSHTPDPLQRRQESDFSDFEVFFVI